MTPGKLRDIIEVVDDEPLLTDEILELTRWAAGYYSSSWGEMLKASLPTGINALIEPIFRVADDLNGTSKTKSFRCLRMTHSNTIAEAGRSL